jgi:hypothetical protein
MEYWVTNMKLFIAMRMKKNNQLRSILFAIGVVIVMAACDNEYEPIFNETTDERVQQALTEYNTLLRSAPHGWKAMLYTKAGGGYFYYFDFNENGIVNMVSDFNETSAAQPMDGTWVLKALQKPTLTFDTYSYIHLPADPDGSVNGGTSGEGLLSDFEFTFVKVSGDSIIMKGLKHSTELYLLKATEEETSRILEDGIEDVLQSTTVYLEDNTGLKLLLPNNTTVPLAIDVDSKLLAAQYLSSDESKIETFISPFTFSLDGIVLKSPVTIGAYSFRELFWDEDKGLYTVQLSNPVDLVNDTEPYFFHPATPLHSVIGRAYKRAFMPENPGENRLPGQSDAFIEAYNEAAGSLLIGPYALTLQDMSYVFDPVNKLMYYDVVIAQTRNGVTSRFLAEFVYGYEVNDTGDVKFTAIGSNDNAQVISFDLRVILQHFDKDTFKLEYIAGGFQLIGGFYSQKSPEYSFSGYLLNQ